MVKLSLYKIIAQLSCLFVLSGCACSKDIRKVCIGNACVQAEVADTDELRQLGLMHRKKLPHRGGMLFIFEREDRYSFWMKNMYIPLDLIWIDKDGFAEDISENIPPCKGMDCPGYSPAKKIKYVLEVNAGFAERHNIKPGDKVYFKRN